MSELYLIVLQGKEELGNDPDAIRLWMELSGVDINTINENTPFDIDIADKLLRTLPEVIERMKEKKERKGEPKIEEVFEVIKKEVEKPTIFEEVEEKRNVDFPDQTKFVIIFSQGKVQKIFGSWDDLKDIITILQKDIKSFHVEYRGDLIVFGEKRGKDWIIAGFEERNLGIARVLFSIVEKKI